MLAFRGLNLSATLETSRHNITRDFFQPLLSTALQYDRGVGYFSSGWLRINAEGMAEFAAHGGRARWITSPILDPKELNEYQDLSLKIARLINNDDIDAEEALEMLLIKRARLLNTAQGKLTALSAVLRSLKRIDHALFYCAPEQMDGSL
ncbi:hypothetical protein [Candidatus Chloroploca sp. Khr17]|uniref:hypothetical protein n=1 Tax=Candidatus Chloroploca sp. Khr17 TaxID=2496869 RepID=UPI00101C0C55|nr:hypothetical protein [Candidatus Chloroploca sp. Khr17]